MKGNSSSWEAPINPRLQTFSSAEKFSQMLRTAAFVVAIWSLLELSGSQGRSDVAADRTLGLSDLPQLQFSN